MSSSSRPTGLVAKSGIELLTFGTPNGHKASILLEELKATYGTQYVFQSINIMENIQKEAWFTKHSPNGRIPAIVDHDRNDFSVFEGAAILTYLTRHYDTEQKFSFKDADDLSRCEQWVAWQHGGLGPMQGQANHFYRLAKERIPYPTQRYVGESERLYGILDTQLSNRDYLVGPGRGKYSIADIASFSWVNVSYFAGVDLSNFPNVERWWKSINDRPAVKKGLAVPSESKIVNEAYVERLKSEEGFKEAEDKLKKLGDEAKKQYDYKYSSP
ncbi:related to URE2-nitrogen catabolite repression regulator [Rhynchosporium graminicola]|uniref:Related to URE2-nitrogen catabolite repression regulator n=1 Tax=Rhynchosporium graminicola TaxID=2792576 RepID=A0A1E1JW00_9HELO|nr:related to URE2-nitrogen catabolite repression regulator [Rhynchosporium commune]